MEMDRHVDPRRVRLIKKGAEGRGPVVYWMSRDQRVRDNWSLLFAIDQAVERRRGVEVVFCLVPSFLGATARQYDFMIRGLKEVEAGLARLHIPFSVFPGLPARTLPLLFPIGGRHFSSPILIPSTLRNCGGRRWQMP